jgi:hypothetical protein
MASYLTTNFSPTILIVYITITLGIKEDLNIVKGNSLFL